MKEFFQKPEATAVVVHPVLLPGEAIDSPVTSGKRGPGQLGLPITIAGRR